MKAGTFRRFSARFIVSAAIIYALLCTLSLLLIPATGGGWLGLQPDAFVAIYAVALSLPWVMILPDMAILGSYSAIATILVGMVANLALLLGLGRWLGRTHRIVAT